MPGKFGTRTNPERMAANDFTTAAILGHEVRDIIHRFGKDIGVDMPENFPNPLPWPCPGKDNNDKGWKLLEYTLFVSKHAYQILKMAHRRYGFIYKIETMPRKPTSLYHVQVSYVGTPALTVVHDEYIKSLLWIIQMLRKSLEIRQRNNSNGQY